MMQSQLFESSYLDPNITQKNNKTYFKAFLLNNLFNKRKFKISNLKNLHKDIDGFENMPVTLVEEGIRKGNHPNPKDGNIFESSYQDKYTYVTKAIDYYRTFQVARIVKIYKPDINLMTASDKEIETNLKNYYALCETTDPKMITMLEASKEKNEPIFVSPAMFSWDWAKDPDTNLVNVNSFVPTHLAIVDSPAYDPNVAYINKETCQKDGMSCYYQLLEAAELENLNNNVLQNNNMSAKSSTPTSSLEDYIKSYYSYDVVDTKSIPVEEIVKNIGNLMIVDKNNVLRNSKPAEAVPIPTNVQEPKAIPIPTTVQEPKQVPLKEEPVKEKQKTGFTLDDVQKLLEQQEERIMSRINAEKTKGEREILLDSYLNNDKMKSVKDKVDQEKLKEERELYNSLPLDNDKLKLFLDRTIYNPKVANENVYTELFALSEENRKEEQVDLNKKNETSKGTPEAPKIPNPNIKVPLGHNEPVTSVPPKSLPNINNYGTEFKSSSDNSNRYNDNYKSKQVKGFEASTNKNEYHPVPTTGESIPKRFQKYIQ